MPEIMVFPSFKLSKNNNVYSPQEDTWFLTDILESQFRQELLSKSRSLLVCELGVGSGFISIALGKKFPQIHVIGVDISLQATLLSHKNMSDWLLPTQFNLVCMDLLQGFDSDRFHPDLVFFNPPYVRTSQKEMKKGFFGKTWAGGPTGLVIIQKFLKDLSRFYFKKAYFLSSIYNANELLKTNFHDIFEFLIIAERKSGDERLLCYEVQLKGNQK